MVAFISGCSDPVKRYRILSFFFDGVPPPKITEPEPTAKKEKDGDSTEKKLLGRPTEHGPYAAKMCYGCHKRDTNELIMPAEKLCLYCHDMNIENRWIHGPIAAGGCRVCHLPHSSGYAYMLVSEPREFCLYCHDKNDILKNDVHMYSDLRCLDCHDAHSGNDRFILKN
ncbi:MAG: cytochrome c3 family protein [Thermodesulfovibrionales bacterium]|nr:cytochrome c3 family protein [Thermodesulfovibrionales bacterium]